MVAVFATPVRSGDANCTGESGDTEICEVARLDDDAAVNPDAPLAIFRKATTFEALMGVRVEFLTMRSGASDAASKLYAKGQLGLLTVAGRGGDAVDIHHGALGVVLTQGNLANSYVEVGYGKNALFAVNPWRFKIDGFLSIGPARAAVKPFAQLVIDADFASGADSIQSFFGLEIDVFRAFRPSGGN